MTDKSHMPWWFELPESIWILVDTSNSNPKSKNYLWWFETEELALEYRQWQNERLKGAELRGPFHFRMGPEQAEAVERHLTDEQTKAFAAYGFLKQASEYDDAQEFIKDALAYLEHLDSDKWKVG